MRKFGLWTMLVFALPLGVSGCKTNASEEGSGFSVLHPSAATRSFIVANDKPFARDVAAHNSVCMKLPACRK